MNVLVLVVDSLRRDYAYSDRTETPTLDELRESGVTFDQAISGASWTPPSMSSIFSGIYPHRLGMYNFDATYPEGVDPIFSILEDAGYEVGSFVFDEQYLFNEVPEANVVDNFRDYEKPKQWIRANADDDFLLFVHHYWVHGPYEPKESAEAWSEANEAILERLRENHEEGVEWCREKYAEAVERMSEDWLAGLLDVLDECGIDEDTMVVFTGDHGEGWGSRYEDPSVMDTNFHLHGKLLYDEHVRVPLVIDDPSGGDSGTVVDDQVRHVDVVPSLLERLDLSSTSVWDLDGESLVPALDGEPIDSRVAISSATDVDLRQVETIAVRDPPYKLIWKVSDDSVELYDLDADPGEHDDVESDRPDATEALLETAKDAYDEIPERVRGVDAAAKDRLRDLGYL